MRLASGRGRSWHIGALALLGLTVVGCAGETETINRVQPNAIEKNVLTEGEWFVRSTIIDTDYGSPTFVGDASSLERVTFEIQEDYLIARRTTEYVTGAEGTTGIVGEDTASKRVVASYAIQGHFDVRRDYNPLTGEEQNVVSENSSDRPWYERDYVRVDWTKNLVDDPSFSLTGPLSGVSLQSVQYFMYDETGKQTSFAPRFERDDAGDVHYFDVVNKYLADPGGEVYIEGYGNISACLLALDSYYSDCKPGELTVRQAFLRVDDQDYEPAVYTVDRMDRAGYFLNVRDGYSEDYGLSRLERDRFISRHNIWMTSHIDQACLQDSECTAVGSRCDLAWGRALRESQGRCTIPYRERDVRPIAYHVSKGFPEDLLEDTQYMAENWNDAFQQTVASLRRLECLDAGESDCAQRYAPATTEDVYVMCHNPVITDDNEACGDVGTVAEIGDIRYNLIAWVPEPHSYSPLGYGPSDNDPQTGRIVSAQAHVYGAPLETYQSRARDILAMMNGDLDVAALQNTGDYIRWIKDQRYGVPTDREAHQHVIGIDGNDVAEANADMDFSWVTDRTGVLPQAPRNMEELAEHWDDAVASVQQVSDDMAFAQKGRANIAKLRGTAIEEMMLNEEVYLRAGIEPGTTMTEEQLHQHSPLRKGNISGMKAVRDYRQRLAHDHRACLLEKEFADAGLMGLVRAIDRAANEGDGTIEWYGRSYTVADENGKIDYDGVRKMIRHPIYQAVMAHEVGHTLGLRHNFAGSFDALNYKQEYWNLRDDGNMEPRAWDPMTQGEIDGRIREYQYSTVMDYGANFIVTDAHGLGHYDVAAIKMGYGDLVEVFTDAPRSRVATISQFNAAAPYGVIGSLDPSSLFTLQTMPYTEWPTLVGGVDNLDKRADVRYSELSVSSNPLLGDAFGLCDPAQGCQNGADASQAVVPYMYCGDEFRDFQPHCLLYDSGADPYEVIQSVIDGYWQYYPFSHFQNTSLKFNPDTVPARTYGRFLAKLDSANRIYSRYRSIFESMGLGDEFFTSDTGFGAYTLGVRASYDLLRQIIAAPEPGTHNAGALPDGTVIFEQGLAGTSPLGGGGGSLEIDSFQGRYLRTGFDFGPEFSWIFFDRAGFFHDKSVAMEVLTYTDSAFIGQDTTTDVREFSTTFYTTFPDSMTDFLGALISGDTVAYAPRYVQDTSTAAGFRLEYPTPSEVIKRALDMPGDILSPNFGFSSQLVAMTYSMSFIPNSFDQDFINKSRIFATGGVESLTLSDDTPMLTFTDQRSGITYQAASYLEDGVEKGIGARMIEQARLLESTGRDAELRLWVDNLDLMRNITGLLGNGGQYTR